MRTQTVKSYIKKAYVMFWNADCEDVQQDHRTVAGGLRRRNMIWKRVCHPLSSHEQAGDALLFPPGEWARGRVSLKDDSLGIFYVTLGSPSCYFLPLHPWCVPFALMLLLWHRSPLMLKVNLLVLRVGEVVQDSDSRCLWNVCHMVDCKIHFHMSYFVWSYVIKWGFEV